ncbi:trypco2 family protein [Microbispora sp. H13382]|uniref:trypco2 family protein n=1 Tax=Microbispora sp. H13382 TaxID=2729112 RepID=UPI001C71BADF
MTGLNNEELIGLAEWLEQLRTELGTASVAGKDQDIRFELGPIDLEVEVTATQERGGKGGIKLWVLNGDASKKRTSGTTQRIKISLTPRQADGASLQVSDRVTGTMPE